MYDELISSLRICRRINSANDNCIAFHDGSCEAEPVCMYELMDKAADAIEEMQRCIDGIEADNDSLCEQLRKSEADNTNLTGWLAEEHAKHQWISVTERLPETRTRCVTISRDGDYGLGIYTTDYGWMFPYYVSEVTHWMPLPEPPVPEPPEREET